jgi:8-oxo-dGTP pyrophosphatase MutT (NUDIX family)
LAEDRFRVRSAVHIFLLRGDQVLLLRRCHTGYEDGNYSVVAGHLEGGETIRAAAAREAREEVGITLSSSEIEIVGVMHRRSNDERIDWFVSARRWEGEPVNREPSKCDQLLWCALDDLPVNVIPYVRRALENAGRGVWFDSFGWGEDAPAP